MGGHRSFDSGSGGSFGPWGSGCGGGMGGCGGGVCGGGGVAPCAGHVTHESCVLGQARSPASDSTR